MAEDNLTFLTEVELPPYCFMSEAVEWIAYGRVPQMQHHVSDETDEIVDYRFYWREMPDNFQPNFEFLWFDRLEFESLGIPIDVDYFSAAEKCAGENVKMMPAQIAEYEERDETIIENDDGVPYNVWKKEASYKRQQLDKLGPLQMLVDDVERQFRPHYDVACAKIFQLLALGKISSQAIDFERWERLVELGEYEKAARFEDVPAGVFTLGLDWTLDEISINEINHVALRVRTQDILDHRAILLQSGNPISVERFGAFYVSRNTGRTSRNNKLGRREMMDWKVLKTHLNEIVLKNTVPQGKESCIFELIAFAEQELGKSPSRTAVQRNLGRELDAIYARK